MVKRVPGSPPSLLAAEAEGLLALGASGAVAVPRVHHQGDGLIMQALGTRPDDSLAFWQRLGEDIAALHAATGASGTAGRATTGWAGCPSATPGTLTVTGSSPSTAC